MSQQNVICTTQNASAHCELISNGQLFIAVYEAPKIAIQVKKTAWQTMAFNVYDMVVRIPSAKLMLY